MKTEIKLITPVLAKIILEKNRNNRPLRSAAVNYYAEQMKKGLWRLTGQGLSFDDKGWLLDGQHRLAAVIKSNTAIEILVITGVASDTFGNYDIGRGRTNSDIFAINGVTNYAPISSIVISFVNIKSKIAQQSSLIRTNLTYNELFEIYNYNPDLYQYIGKFVSKCRKRYPIIKNSALGGIIAYLIIDRKYDKEYIFNFFNELYQFIPGTNKSVDALRNTLIRNLANPKKYSSDIILNLTLRCFNYYKNGINISFLRVPEGRVIVTKNI